jgi:hypothetical protein
MPLKRLIGSTPNRLLPNLTPTQKAAEFKFGARIAPMNEL